MSASPACCTRGRSGRRQSAPSSSRATPIVREEVLGEAGDVKAASGSKTLSAVYQWPIQTHGSIGPSCGVAEVTREGATVWTASQSTHKYWPHFAKTLGLPQDKVR